MDNVTKVLLAIVTVALVATVVVNGTNSAKVVSAAGGSFTNALTAAQKG